MGGACARLVDVIRASIFMPRALTRRLPEGKREREKFSAAVRIISIDIYIYRRSNLIEPNSLPCPPLAFLYYHGTGGRRTAGGGKTRATSVEHVWNARYAPRCARGECRKPSFRPSSPSSPVTGKSISIDPRFSENSLNRAELRRQVGKSIPRINPFTGIGNA